MAKLKKSISTKKKKNPNKITQQVKAFVFSAQGFPFILSLTVVSILFVLFRMKGVEQDYLNNTLSKEIDQTEVDGKELKAQKARLLSVKNLRGYAQNFDMKEPKQSQVIIVP